MHIKSTNYIILVFLLLFQLLLPHPNLPYIYIQSMLFKVVVDMFKIVQIPSVYILCVF